MSGKRKPLTTNRRIGIIAVTGALTATTAITGVLAVNGSEAAPADPAASATSTDRTQDLQDHLLAAREASRADRGRQRSALAVSKPKPKPKPKPRPKARPTSTSGASHTARPAGRSASRHAAARSRSSHSGGITCSASYYDEPQSTASGETFDPSALTAAHRTLPLGSRVRVTNVSTGDSVVVRINDRGPYAGGRCLDLSRAAFDEIASLSAGVVRVRYQVL